MSGEKGNQPPRGGGGRKGLSRSANPFIPSRLLSTDAAPGNQPPRGGGGGRAGLSLSAIPYIPSRVLSTDAAPRQPPRARVEASPSTSITPPRVEASPSTPITPPRVEASPSTSITPPISSVMVRANHFLVTSEDTFTEISCYKVSIFPSVPKEENRNFFNKLAREELASKMMPYDGLMTCFAAGELPFQAKNFRVKLVDDRKENKYKVRIALKLKTNVQLSKILEKGRHNDEELRIIFQFINLVFRQEASNRYLNIGRSFFDPIMCGNGDLGNGVKYWLGYFHSCRPTKMGLSLNFDVTAKPFYEPIVVTDYIIKYLGNLSGSLSCQELTELKKALIGVEVEISSQGLAHQISKEGTRGFMIQDITHEGAEHVMFDETLSVSDYYLNRYHLRLNYPNLPFILARSCTEWINLPMELCKIEDGQRYTNKLNGRQLTAFLDAGCLRPQKREQKIKEIFTNIKLDKDEFVEGFGLRVRPELTSVKARVLPTPRLIFGQRVFEEPVNGKWKMTGKKLVKGGGVKCWACINFSTLGLVVVNEFCRQLIDMCSSMGMEFNRKPLIRTSKSPPDQIEKSLEEMKDLSLQTEERLQLLIIILPYQNGKYGTVKRVLDIKFGIVSQCCQPKKAMQPNNEYLEYLSLKINVKVGGRNTVLEQAIKREMPCINEEHTIIFGSDVNHPKPGDKSRFSIAAVVATMDWPELTKYKSLVSAQAHREEIIQDLYAQKYQIDLVHGGMIRELLISYRDCNRVLPKKIIFYRDGVGEDKFNDVRSEEVTAIKNACKSFENYTPTITFVVVQKKHNTRLFPADRTGSILPGTVVDTEICHPSGIDFYLCSHNVNKGTSNATHYQVIYNDDDNSTNDDIQKLTYLLCYTCNKSVSVVPPAYYAHLAALRAHYYVEGVKFNDSQLPTIKIHDDVKDTMFFV